MVMVGSIHTLSPFIMFGFIVSLAICRFGGKEIKKWRTFWQQFEASNENNIITKVTLSDTW